jgi:hypothetical protein
MYIYKMSKYQNFVKKWSNDRDITSFFGSDKREFLKDWERIKSAKIREEEKFGEEMGREDINRAGEAFKKPKPKISATKKVPVASKVLDNPDLMNLIQGYVPSSKKHVVEIDDDRYEIKGDKIARYSTGIIITDKKLVARLFKKLSAQRIAIANKMPIPEKKTRKPSKAQEEKASKERERRYNSMREDMRNQTI